MASSVNLAKIIEKLECGVCANTLCEPRMLQCNHQFCKKCLDSMLDFGQDGSAFIKCPHGCNRITSLSSTYTTNDLDIDYRVCEILEIVDEKQKRGRPSCDTCKNDVTKTTMSYYVPSQKFKCNKCKDPRDVDIQYGNSIPVKFDLRQRDWDILCEEHGTVADSMCCDTKFVCVFCRHRKHQGHPNCDSLDTAQEKLRGMLSEGLKFNQDYVNSRNSTTRNISTMKSTFDELIKIKKLKKMEEFVKYLNEEEEKLKREFYLVSSGHTKLFNKSDQGKFFKDCLQMNRLQLLVQKAHITDEVPSQHRVIRETIISLTDSNFRDEHPLGCLNVLIGDQIPIEQGANSFRSKLPDGHMSDPFAMRNLFNDSPHMGKYIQGLARTVQGVDAEEVVEEEVEEEETEEEETEEEEATTEEEEADEECVECGGKVEDGDDTESSTSEECCSKTTDDEEDDKRRKLKRPAKGRSHQTIQSKRKGQIVYKIARKGATT